MMPRHENIPIVLKTLYTNTKGNNIYFKFINNELFSPKPTSYACLLQNETLSNSVHLFKRYLATRNFEQQSRAITLKIFDKINPSAIQRHSFLISTLMQSSKKSGEDLPKIESEKQFLTSGP